MSSQEKHAGGRGDGLLEPDPDPDLDDERQLRYERDFWKSLFEGFVANVPSPVFVTNREGRITHWNDANEDIAGLTDEATIGEVAHDVVGTEAVTETLAEEVARIDEPVEEDRIRTGKNPDGERWHIRASAVPLHDPDGDVVGALEVITQVTELVESREAVATAHERISEEVEASVSDLLSTAEEVADSTDYLASTADEQVETVERVHSEVESVSATVEEIAAQADTVTDQSQRVKAEATASLDATEETLELIDEVETAAADLASHSEALEREVAEVEDVVDVIGEVASQINMLALNANIEAARSSSGDDGFAVVANEIKDLADRSRKEAEAIEDTIRAVTEIADETTDGIERTTERVDRAAENVADVRDRQADIRSAADDAAAGVEEIATATDQQAASSEEVTSMLEDVVDDLEAVVDEIDDLAGANEQQAERATDVRRRVRAVESELESSVGDGT